MKGKIIKKYDLQTTDMELTVCDCLNVLSTQCVFHPTYCSFSSLGVQLGSFEYLKNLKISPLFMSSSATSNTCQFWVSCP